MENGKSLYVYAHRPRFFKKNWKKRKKTAGRKTAVLDRKKGLREKMFPELREKFV